MIEKEHIWPLRHVVMWPEKEFDFIKLKDDDQGTHYGLYEGEELISGVSIFVDGIQAQFRKFATLPAYQGKGYGSKLLNYVLDQAEQQGIERIFCNARTNKASFYEKFGLSRTESTFSKEGKDYVVMERFY